MTSFRIGSVKQRKPSECQVRKLLKDVRDNDDITQLFFYDIEFTARIKESMYKLLVRDGRLFSSIKLLSCSGDLTSIVSMIMDHSCTEALTLSHVELSTLHAVNDALRTNQSLRVLRISGATFLEDCLEGLAFNCTLEELDLCGSHVSEHAIESLSRCLLGNRTLRALRLNDCDLEDHAMAEIIKCLLDNESLEELDLSNNTASSEALEMIGELIQRDNKIEKVSLSCLRLSEDLDQDILHNTIKSLASSTLTDLDISGNYLSDDAVRVLAECLCKNTALKTLDVSESQITEIGIKAFAKKLPLYKGLTVLNLAENDITDHAASSLVDGLVHNRRIQSLGPIEGFNCSDAIEHYLDLNLAGRRALQNDIALSVWPHLLARTARAELGGCGRRENCLYTLLRGPALFAG